MLHQFRINFLKFLIKTTKIKLISLFQHESNDFHDMKNKHLPFGGSNLNGHINKWPQMNLNFLKRKNV